MYIPNPQQVLAAGLAACGSLREMVDPHTTAVARGEVLDYAVEKCLDDDGNVRCTKPFLVQVDKCYQMEWKTEGVVSHTTVEVRDAASGEVVFYRDTNGQWTPEKGELVYMDFKPKVWKTGNDTVEYTVKTCK